MRNQKRHIALLAAAIMILTIVPAITAETAVAAEKESKLARVKLVNHAVEEGERRERLRNISCHEIKGKVPKSKDYKQGKDRILDKQELETGKGLLL